MQDVTYRPAFRSDCRTIAERYHISSDGVADYIWASLAQPEEDNLDVGQRRYEQGDSVFSYTNCTIVELEGRIIGMLVAFPMMEDSGEGVGDDTVDPVLAPHSTLEEPGSCYICCMAMFPCDGGRGPGAICCGWPGSMRVNWSWIK